MLLIYPPATRPCEPSAGIARLKPRRRSLSITGNEDFEPFGERDLGPLIVKQLFFRERRLRVVVPVPAGIEPQVIPIRGGSWSGEVEKQRSFYYGKFD